MTPRRHAVFESAALATSSAQLLAPSALRCSILLSPHPTVTYAISDKPMASLNDGVVVTPTGGPVLVRREDFGDLLCKAWYGLANAAIDVRILVGYVEAEAA
jgi:hypothetical protein